MHGSNISHKLELLRRQASDLQHGIMHASSLTNADLLQAILEQFHISLEQMQALHQEMLEHDIAAQKQMERQLHQSEECFRHLAEMSPDGLLVHRDSRVVFVNTAAASILGASHPQQLIGMDFLDLVHPDCRQQVQQRIEQVHDGAAMPFQEEKLIRLDGQVAYVEVTATPITLDDQPTILCLCRDITERRRLQQEIVTISNMERSRIGRDLHDALGQSLTGISYVGKVLEKKLQQQQIPEAAEASEICQLAGQSMHQARCLARGLLSTELRADELVANLKALAMDAQQVFGISCHLESPHNQLVMDDKTATHLYHIAQECLTNAVKHGKAHSVRIQLDIQHSSMALMVVDDGVGFSDTNHSPGIGLRIMRHRADLIGGKLTIQSNPDTGTTVICTIPATNGRND